MWTASLAPRTVTTYSTGYQSYLNFLIRYQLCHPLRNHHQLPVISEILLQYFIAYCFSVLHVQCATVKNYLAGIRFVYLRAGIDTCLDHPTAPSMSRLQTLLRGYKKLHISSTKKRLPITYNILTCIVAALRNGVFGAHDDLVMEAMCSLAFFGFLRCGEFTCAKSFDPEVNVCIKDVVLHPSQAKCAVNLKTSKTDPFRQGVTVNVFATSGSCCPFSSMRLLMFVRLQCGAKPCDAMFTDRGGLPVARSAFLSWLNIVLCRIGLNPSLYSGHSFRIGAATTAAHVNIQDHMIKTLGRWSSDCFTRYIRTPEDDIRRAHSSMARS
ncbi:uncharacterized protein [Haliotis cracherodii]|uniref:uncharacterized protein n=1 Tax=Haliotis cracherodii TaxID=6455 RepID=UPI0039EAFC41